MSSIQNALRAANFGYLCAVGITLLTEEFSLFTWHPLAMVLYWALLCEGVIIQKQKKASIHRWFMLGAATSALTGASIMYQLKESTKSPHFQTTHSLYGSLIATILIGQASGAMFFFRASNHPVIWYFHKVFGYVMCIGTWYVGWLHMGSEKGWFMTHPSIQENIRLMSIGRVSYITSGIFLLFIAYGK
jgi:hypothetical protein